MSDKPTMIMLVGLPASGKSTYAKEVVENGENRVLLSSDSIRKELYGDESTQGNASEVFNILHKRAREALKNGVKFVFVDSTNIRSKQRMAFLQSLNKIDCYRSCAVMATPYKECLKRNAERDRVVPESVIERMYMQWETPFYWEGFDNIAIFRSDDIELKDPKGFIDKYWDFDQDNPHHQLSLGKHCKKAAKYYGIHYAYISEGYYATLLHDCGKPFTKQFKNSKGEDTNIAHYYSHEHVGGYEALFYKRVGNPLLVSSLICWHMRPYYWERDNNEKLRLKYKKMWGEKFYNDVMKLHEADKAAH